MCGIILSFLWLEYKVMSLNSQVFINLIYHSTGWYLFCMLICGV